MPASTPSPGQPSTDERLRGLVADLDRRPDFPIDQIRRRVAIISTPRCGSSLFCDVLRDTGLAGDPREWVNFRHVKAYAAFLGLREIRFDDYFGYILRKTTTGNGVFTLNFHVEHYLELHKRGVDLLSLGFDHVYYLYRRDRLQQALSFARATLTDQWSSYTETEAGAMTRVSPLQFVQALQHILASEHHYAEQLRQHVAREFCYEDFSRLHETDVFEQVFEDLGLEGVNKPASVERTRQRRSSADAEVRELLWQLAPGFDFGDRV